MKVLFLCSRNRLRSPTAQQIFAEVPGWEVDSAGIAPDAEHVVSREELEWADLIFVMERRHRSQLQRRFGSLLREKRLVVLSIPDDYDFMQAELVDLLRQRVGPYTPSPMQK